MIAVETKQGLQRHRNILLPCLALTSLMDGLAVQPFHITMTIFLLHGGDFHSIVTSTLHLAAAFNSVLIRGE